MIHRLCDYCCECESVDFMVTIDDDIYCVECHEEMEKEYDNERKNIASDGRH